MADPITPDHYRAMVLFHGHSGLPRDVFVNSFVARSDHTFDPGQSAADRRLMMHEDFRSALSSFYGEANANGSRVSDFMNFAAIDRVEIRTYDLAQTPPRDPISSVIDTTSWAVSTESAGLPFEVALCVSWKTPVNRAWGRGRTYVGPLETSVLTGSTAANPRPSATVLTTLAQASARYLSGLLIRPVVLGKNGTNEIIGGYIDDEFDTQRRRGQDSTARTTFVKPS